ncbi:hypothetical protein GT20_3058 [Parageobacillus thermoglucosidasius TNO-09.020]|nr:hypothetical protein GT20_3058 [Parageobacillus thermoglucosidasius TNO-09.020]
MIFLCFCEYYHQRIRNAADGACDAGLCLQPLGRPGSCKNAELGITAANRLVFFAAKWRLFGLLVPTYWVSEAVLALAEENVKFWGYWLGGTAYHLLCIWLLFSRFNRLLH